MSQEYDAAPVISSFGRFAPALTLVLTMVLRLVPTYERRALEIASARQCIGKGVKSGGIRNRVAGGMEILSALITWSLEGAITTSDSMRSRGYGYSKRRTTYIRYFVKPSDVWIAVVFIVTFLSAATCVASGYASCEYIPQIEITPFIGWTVFGLLTFSVFLFVPFFLNTKEAVLWRFLISRI